LFFGFPSFIIASYLLSFLSIITCTVNFKG
jgi:hypothetical protein